MPYFRLSKKTESCRTKIFGVCDRGHLGLLADLVDKEEFCEQFRKTEVQFGKDHDAPCEYDFETAFSKVTTLWRALLLEEVASAVFIASNWCASTINRPVRWNGTEFVFCAEVCKHSHRSYHE